MLIDENNFFLNPLVQRTWARKGKTPMLRTFGVPPRQGLGRSGLERGARGDDARARTFTLTPSTPSAPKRSRLFCAKGSGISRRGRVIVLWDGDTNHKGPLVRDLLARYPRLQLEPLPTYAPQLNPVEFV